MDCIFCKIVKKEIPAEIVYEDDKIIAFNDVNPVAPVHILIIPKKHIPSVNHLADFRGMETKDGLSPELENKTLVGELILAAQKIAEDKKIADSGYRLSFNIGEDAGQTVYHLHLHLMGGKKLPLA